MTVRMDDSAAILHSIHSSAATAATGGVDGAVVEARYENDSSPLQSSSVATSEADEVKIATAESDAIIDRNTSMSFSGDSSLVCQSLDRPPDVTGSGTSQTPSQITFDTEEQPGEINNTEMKVDDLDRSVSLDAADPGPVKSQANYGEEGNRSLDMQQFEPQVDDEQTASANSAFESSNISLNERADTDINDQDNSRTEPSPPTPVKSVRFAPTNKLRQFNTNNNPSTSITNEETDIDIHTTTNNTATPRGKCPRLKRKRVEEVRSLLVSQMLGIEHCDLEAEIDAEADGSAVDGDEDDVQTGSSESDSVLSNVKLQHDEVAMTTTKTEQHHLKSVSTLAEPEQTLSAIKHSPTSILRKSTIHPSNDSALHTVLPEKPQRSTQQQQQHQQQYLKRQKQPANRRKHPIRVALLHSHSHTQILHDAMKFIHQDRDLLLEALLKWCGILHGATKGKGALSSFLTVVPPKLGTRKLLETFHGREYLDLLQFPKREGDDSETHVVDEDSTEYQKLLAQYGLEDDCPIPTDPNARTLHWHYCLAVAGASWQAASLLIDDGSHGATADVAIHWGGGRHHAHANKAGGFCYVNDVVLAINRLVDGGAAANRNVRVLYIDIDIHAPDGVQQAFYSTDQVLTASFHRHSPGFFPASSGSTKEKGAVGTKGLGYNLNVPLPAETSDVTFLQMYRTMLFGLVKAYDPHAIVLCVGADGLENDALVCGGGVANKNSCFSEDDTGGGFYTSISSTGEGWKLSPETLAECVRIASLLCAGLSEGEICVQPCSAKQSDKSVTTDTDRTRVDTDNCTANASEAVMSSDAPVSSLEAKPVVRGKRRKLLLLGGGGYSPHQAARSWLLCTAAACEGARAGLLWNELPKDIPAHCYFPRYGPTFELVSKEKVQEIHASYSHEAEIFIEVSAPDQKVLQDGIRSIELSCLYIDRQQEKAKRDKELSKRAHGDAFCSYDTAMQGDDVWIDEGINTLSGKKQNARGGGRRKKKKKVRQQPPS